jgi:hypothetical protein
MTICAPMAVYDCQNNPNSVLVNYTSVRSGIKTGADLNYVRLWFPLPYPNDYNGTNSGSGNNYANPT